MERSTASCSPRPTANHVRGLSRSSRTTGVRRGTHRHDVLGSGRAPGKIALITPEGDAREVADDLAFPNGMVVTPDNGTLIVAESFARRLTAFDIAADGSLAHRRVWADVTGDGICIDAEG
jgi:sugar lactone lactonase YvrE